MQGGSFPVLCFVALHAVERVRNALSCLRYRKQHKLTFMESQKTPWYYLARRLKDSLATQYPVKSERLKFVH